MRSHSRLSSGRYGLMIISLEPAPASSEQQEENDYQKKQTDATTTVIADSGSHVVATPTCKQLDDDQIDDYWHARKCSTMKTG